MEVSAAIYLGLLCAAGAGRLAELRLSARNQRRLAEKGARKPPDPNYRWMAAFHGGLLAAAGLEVVLLERPFLPWLGGPALAVWAAANAVRWWVIRTLGEHWNTQVLSSAHLGVVSEGPYRWVRHPNYTAVFAEMLALPLAHTAWMTALAGAAAHARILQLRVRLEEEVLLADGRYRELMGGKPRFLPRLGWSGRR